MNLKMKNFVLLALLTALYVIVYFVGAMLISLIGPFGDSISPGVCGLLSGAILVFITRKIGKMWQFTIMELIVMGVFALIGSGYLPWFITSMIGAVLADVIASTSQKPSVVKIAIASGILHVGNALGGIIPACFFAEQYMNEWIARGQKPEQNASNGKSSSRYNGYSCDNHYIRIICDWCIHWLCNIKRTFKREVIEIVL